MLIKTEKGLEIEVIDNAFDDIETLDALSELVDGSPFAISKLSKRLFKESEKKKLYDFYRSNDGRLNIETYTAVLTEIMSKLGQKEKN